MPEKFEKDIPPTENDKEKTMELKIQILKNRWNEIVKKHPIEASMARFEFAEKLRKEYGEQEGCQKYAAFHILAGSTFELEDTPYFDFPGEDSIESYVDKMLEQLGGKNKEIKE